MLNDCLNIFITIFLLTCAQLFANCNLSGQEIETEKQPWPYIINELNRAEDINDSSKIKHLLKVSSLIRMKDAAPTKDDLLALKSNRARLLLINILIERKKYLWAEDIFSQIDSRKLNAIECRLLFELETIFILKFPDSEISLNLQESLNSLIKVCGPELKLNPGHLVDLFQFYVNKQLLAEALVIADILWKDDEYHFHCGQLHQKSYRIRWESKDTYHWQKAKDHFEIIEKDFPKSRYLIEAYTNLIVLSSEIESAAFLDKMMREKLFPNIEKVAPENVANILDAFSNKATDPIIIQLLKDWYHLLLEKKATLLGEEMIVTFLIEKCGLTLNDLVLFLNNGESNNKITSRLKNASLQKEIQFLVYWNSEWVPNTDFQSAATEFRYDTTTKTPYLISKNKQNQPISFAYNLQKDQLLPDYIFIEIRSLIDQNILSINFNYDGKQIEIEKIVCTQEKKIIRIPITDAIKVSKKWMILINNANDKKDSTQLEISAPSFFMIKKISDLDKMIGE